MAWKVYAGMWTSGGSEKLIYNASVTGIVLHVGSVSYCLLRLSFPDNSQWRTLNANTKLLESVANVFGKDMQRCASE